MDGAVFRHPLKVLPIKCFDYLARIKSIPENCTSAYLNSPLGDGWLSHKWISQAQDVSGERK